MPLLVSPSKRRDGFSSFVTVLSAALVILFAPRWASAGSTFAVGNYSYGGILLLNQATGATLGTISPTVVGPTGMTFGPDGNLYVSDYGDSAIGRFDVSTGVYTRYFVSQYSGGLERPEALAFGPDGYLYVANLAAGPAVLRYNGTTGAFIDAFVPQYSGGLYQPFGLTFGPDKNLYVSDLESPNTVRLYDGSTGAFMDNFTSSFYFGGTDAITFGPDGNLYETDENDSLILRFNGKTGAFMDVFASGSGLSHPSGVNSLAFRQNSGSRPPEPRAFRSVDSVIQV